MLSSHRFNLGPRTVFGCGTIDDLPSIVAKLPHRRALLITDPGLVAAGICTEVSTKLADAGIETGVFDAVQANPSTDTLAAGAEALRSFGDAVVIAVGGGSVLDAAKGIALVAVNRGSPRDFDYRHRPARPGLPIIAIPTTAGTGSETNGFGVIEDAENRSKFYVGDDSVIPLFVILDPSLTRGLPPFPTAATGIDVLAHAVESLCSRRTNPYAEGLNLQVVGMVARYLPVVVKNGQDIEARAQMLLAAHMAGLAFATTGLGLAHAVSHALSAQCGAAHGAALAVMLPPVLSFNRQACTATHARITSALSVSGVDKDGRTPATGAAAAIRRLSTSLGMPDTLRELGCTEDSLASLVRAALADDVIVNTPRLPECDELKALLVTVL